MDMEVDRGALLLIALFVGANLLGLAAGSQLLGEPAVQEASQQYQQPASGGIFFLVIGLASAVLFLLYRYDVQLLVKAWFGLALLLTTLIFFDAFLPSLAALVLAAGVIAVRFRTRDMLTRNAADMVAFAGAGALFGALLSVRASLVLFVLLGIYDYVAVNLSGHMVTLAKKGAETGTFMGFSYPKEGDVDLDDMRDLADAGDGDAPAGTETVSVGVLGGGDVIVPMIFAVALLGDAGVTAALFAVGGAAAALYLFLTKMPSDRFFPAIPVVGSGAVFATAVWLLLATLV